jgi:alpha-tubulin suppressor-like RCC1 family protein
MHRILRQFLRLFLFALLPLLLVACGGGSDDTEDYEYYELISSTVYGEHSLLIKTGETYAWGANGYGQLGIGSKLNRTTPQAVTGNFSAVSIGGAHSVGLDTDAGGEVWTWGHNSSGQLGDNTIVTKTSPVQVLSSDEVTPLTGIKAIAAGGKHTLAVASDNTVVAWGSNTYGQLGNGTKTSSRLPVAVSGLTDVTAIAAGGEFSLALKSDGTVWAWGNNSKGQLGINSTVTSSTPEQVVGLTGINKIAAGGSHALALKDDGTIYAWGYNEFGQLGDGTITSSKVPVAVDMTGTATAISAGLDHSVAIIDGSVKAWGYNYYGQLGNGAILQSYDPVKTLQTVQDQAGNPLANIEEIVATGHHCIGRDSNGDVWTWGRNSHGQLGDGTTVSRSRAKVVSGL